MLDSGPDDLVQAVMILKLTKLEEEERLRMAEAGRHTVATPYRAGASISML